MKPPIFLSQHGVVIGAPAGTTDVITNYTTTPRFFNVDSEKKETKDCMVGSSLTRVMLRVTLFDLVFPVM
ncbi:hypothetical protein V6N12_060716 [Hibiscus sabdariffa]|uniref:Uncharacterized protein n=1 Tax=Hibiscus sabdariffa TaxID=183260 RepID=A0ABR2D593_9ROSI